jgi:hypothetical protein
MTTVCVLRREQEARPKASIRSVRKRVNTSSAASKRHRAVERGEISLLDSIASKHAVVSLGRRENAAEVSGDAVQLVRELPQLLIRGPIPCLAELEEDIDGLPAQGPGLLSLCRGR